MTFTQRRDGDAASYLDIAEAIDNFVEPEPDARHVGTRAVSERRHRCSGHRDRARDAGVLPHDGEQGCRNHSRGGRRRQHMARRGEGLRHPARRETTIRRSRVRGSRTRIGKPQCGRSRAARIRATRAVSHGPRRASEFDQDGACRGGGSPRPCGIGPSGATGSDVPLGNALPPFVVHAGLKPPLPH